MDRRRFAMHSRRGFAMRYSRWTVVPLLAGLMLACSDSTGVTETDLVGTWKASEFTFSDFGDPVMDFHVIEPGGSVTMVINADKTYMLIVTLPVSLPDTTTGTWALPTSSRLVLTECDVRFWGWRDPGAARRDVRAPVAPSSDGTAPRSPRSAAPAACLRLATAPRTHDGVPEGAAHAEVLGRVAVMVPVVMLLEIEHHRVVK